MRNDELEARRITPDKAILELDDPEWALANPVQLDHYWDGSLAPQSRHAEARLVWSEVALHCRFVCHQDEPLVVTEHVSLHEKTIGLWERDVCEIFVAPGASTPEDYFEFEAAPTGEWLDLDIDYASGGRRTNWEFNSGMTARTEILSSTIVISITIPFIGLNETTPQIDDVWRLNLFRCVGAGDARGYLAWRPTFTATPNFHVPEKFGRLRFTS